MAGTVFKVLPLKDGCVALLVADGVPELVTLGTGPSLQGLTLRLASHHLLVLEGGLVVVFLVFVGRRRVVGLGGSKHLGWTMTNR